MLAAICHGTKDLRVEAVGDAPLAPDEVRVRVAFGGICGSDLHYYHRGGVGDFRIRQPLTLGHEVSGTLIETGTAVRGLEPGMPVALDPARPCLHCRYCRAGRANLCADMRFLGSAGRFPHVQGGFSQHLVLRQDQVIPVPAGTDLLQLSVAEPLSVALHAVTRAGPLSGRRVIVTGSGPIGLLTMQAARLAGAIEVLATDVADAPLALARSKMGATATLNVSAQPDALAPYAEAGGHYDVAFEVSGAPSALASLFTTVRRGARIVQVGMLPPGAHPLPVNVLQTREIELAGAFRANDEFRLAVELIVGRRIDVTPILSGTWPLAEAAAALEVAGDRNRYIKLHLQIDQGLAPRAA
jgi:L-idonate 5-dehydrogenase